MQDLRPQLTPLETISGVEGKESVFYKALQKVPRHTQLYIQNSEGN